MMGRTEIWLVVVTEALHMHGKDDVVDAVREGDSNGGWNVKRSKR